MHELAERIRKGEERALARAISYVENDHPDKLELLKDIHPFTGAAHYVGITGSPGAGKSSLVNRLIRHLRSLGKTVGIVAVDPTSPFSGGALLGDRVRMAEHFTDEGVFIRSMGTRGSLGGLSRTTKETVRLMDAYGCDVVLIETVGVGQSELDIMKIADSIAVVLTPGSGDAVQVFKAGIMEIADLFVINKADLPGVPKLLSEVEGLLGLLDIHKDEWQPPIVQTVAARSEGVAELWQKLECHRDFLQKSGEGNKRRLHNLEEEVYEVVHYEVMRHIVEKEKERADAWLEGLQKGQSDPYTIANLMVRRWINELEERESDDKATDSKHSKG